jgi:hypothetical protein
MYTIEIRKETTYPVEFLGECMRDPNFRYDGEERIAGESEGIGKEVQYVQSDEDMCECPQLFVTKIGPARVGQEGFPVRRAQALHQCSCAGITE